jgi:TonB family protein
MNSAVGWRTLEGSTVDGKFPLRQWLGGSDHSAVFLTERMIAGVTGPQRAAIKLISPNGSDSDTLLSRWRSAQQLWHPHLIRIFDSGSCQLDGERMLYVVMECADEDLSQILPQRPLTPGEAGDILPPLLDALSYLHEKGFVHGRIRPSNLLAVGDQLKLSSDAIGSASNPGPSRLRLDAYDAPETATGMLLPESDLWSVGALLMTALTQHSPAPQEDSQRNPVVPASMPEPFRGIARECLHSDPRRRISIAGITDRLQPAGRSVPAEAETPAQRRSSRAPVTIAIVVIALVVAAVAFFSRGKGDSSKSSEPQSVTSQPSPPAQTSSGTSNPSASASSGKPAAAPAPNVPASSSPAPAAASAASTPKPKRSRTSSVQGGVVHQVIPEVSKSARNTITGKIRVTVRVDVDNSGNVTTAKLTSAGPSAYFARVALKAAQGWQFAPAPSDGQAAPNAWLLHFRFGRRGTEVSPERVTH